MNAPEKLPDLPAKAADSADTKSKWPTVHISTRKLDFDVETLAALSPLNPDSQLDAKKRIETVRTALKSLAKEDEDVQKTFFQAFYETLRRYSKTMRMSTEEAEGATLSQLLAMSDFSRRKHSTFLLKQEIGKKYDGLPEEERLALEGVGETRERYVKSRLRTLHTALSVYPEELIGRLNETVGMGTTAVNFHGSFFTNQNAYDTLDELCGEFGLDVPTLIEFAEAHPEFKINVSKLRRSVGQSETESQQNLASNLLAPVEKPVNEKIARVLDLELREVEANGFINPNWFLYDIGTYLGIKVYGEQKMKYVFGNYFFDAVRKMDATHSLGLRLPDFYNLCQFRLAKKGPDGKPSASSDGKPELIDVAQHVFEWKVPKEFSFAQLKELAAALRGGVPDLLASSPRSKDFRHPVKTVVGRQTYSGFFSDVKDFENTNLLLIKSGERDGESRVRISTDLGQDQFLYLLIQASRFLSEKEGGKTLDPTQLWALIYRSYNALSVENAAKFDISIFKKQYADFARTIIWPLSREYFEKHGKAGKARHTALVGLYGTGKSQFLTSLLAKKEFDVGGKKLHLNANTVNMGIMNLVDILSKDASDFKRRLSDIHENTKMPIILVIEDIETIVNEKEGISDIITQALTNLFEGVGSLPITMVTTTNYPERISDRLVRPNRIDSIIRFDVPLGAEIVLPAMAAHVANNGLSDRIANLYGSTEAFAAKFEPRMSDFTTSHIAAFIESIRETVEFEDSFDTGFELSEERVEKLFRDVLLPVEDIRFRQKCITEWDEKHHERGGRGKIGF